jgi:hypothetical protein
MSFRKPYGSDSDKCVDLLTFLGYERAWMAEISVIPSAPLDVEMLLRWLLERRGEFQGLVVATIDHDGTVLPWATQGVANCCISHASLVLQQEALERGRELADFAARVDPEPSG